MRNWIAKAGFLLAAASAATASATPPDINGSDTLFGLMTDLITNNCGGATNVNLTPLLNYVGGGSGTAPNAMISHLSPGGAAFQQVAGPMSRSISAGECANAAIVDKSKVEGLVIGLDGIVIVGDSQVSLHCGGGHTQHEDDEVPGSQFSDLPVNTTSWKNLLKLLFLGIQSNGAVDCKSSARQALVSNYASMFEGGCTSTPCGSIAHAFRRADLSGTTDTFLALIGAPGVSRDAVSGRVTFTPFCNGLDTEDKDPIRRSCDQSEQVCEADGTLGVVLPILPPSASQDKNFIYNAAVSAPFAKIRPALGTACPFPPDSNTDPTGAKVSPCGPSVIYNLPPGCSFPNSPRCDCRFPIPTDFISPVITGTTTPCPGGPFLPNPEFNWNRRAGGCSAVNDGNSPLRWGLLNGDNGSLENSPSTWGTRAVRTLAGIPSDRPSLPTAQRCCLTRCPPIPPATTGVTVFTREDPRVMNLALRVPTGSAAGRIQDFQTLTKTGSAAAFTPAFYRIHANEAGLTSVGLTTPPVESCQEPDATRQIACMVQHSSHCSVGFAAREASDGNDGFKAEPFTVGGINPTIANIQKLISDPANAYPLSRRIYYNSLIGFGNGGLTNPNGPATNFQNAQFNLYKCMADVSLGRAAGIAASRAALDRAGFVEVPFGPKLCKNMCTSNTSCLALDAVPAAHLSPAFIDPP